MNRLNIGKFDEALNFFVHSFVHIHYHWAQLCTPVITIILSLQ